LLKLSNGGGIPTCKRTMFIGEGVDCCCGGQEAGKKGRPNLLRALISANEEEISTIQHTEKGKEGLPHWAEKWAFLGWHSSGLRPRGRGGLVHQDQGENESDDLYSGSAVAQTIEEDTAYA